MKNTGKIAVAVAGGYLLGRGHNAKLAIGLGLWLTGKKITLDPARLPELVQRLPVLGELNEQIRGDLTRIGKEAGSKALTAQGDRLADALNRRTESLRGTASAATGGDAGPEEPEDEDESAERDEVAGTERASKSSEDGPDDGAEDGRERGSAQSRARRSRPAKTADAAGRPARGAARKPASSAKRAASSAARTPARKRATAEQTDGGGRNG